MKPLIGEKTRPSGTPINALDLNTIRITTIMRLCVFTFATVGLLAMPFCAIAESNPSAKSSTVDLTTGQGSSITAAAAIDVVREGTRLMGRTGRLNHTADGQQAIFTFDADSSGYKDPPMIVLPNLNLFLMETVITSRSGDLDFRISGTVNEYKGRNYILLDSVETTVAAASRATSAAVLPKPVARADSQIPSPVATDRPTTIAAPGPAAEQTMNRLLTPPLTAGEELRAPAQAGPAVDKTTGNAAVAPAAPVLTVVREGTYLTNRTARLSHSADGQQAILTFDADGKSMKDPPMVILPNLKLSSMESAVLGRSVDVHFRVSGTVTEYKGRNFILLNKAAAMPDLEVQF